MEFNYVQVAAAMITFILLVGGISYWLGLKKSASPIKTGLIGGLFSIIPIMGIIYLLYLFTREDIHQ